MDVRCDRCGTEYEFDDALISERGTTVQCTECGSKFKIFPSAGAGAPERWIVRGGGAPGWETHFVSLRDLQAAIMRGAVGPTDMLSRGDEPPRALSTIAELAPLFAERKEKKLGGTLAGVAPQLNASGAPIAPLPDTGSRAPEPPTQAVPAKRRVSTKMGLPTPADAPPGFTSLSAPPPELTPDAPPVQIPQPSRTPQRPFDKTLASGLTDAPVGAEQKRSRGIVEPAAPPARDYTSTLQSFGGQVPGGLPPTGQASPAEAAPRSPAPPGASHEHPSQPRQRIVSVLSASELSASPQPPPVASAPLDKPPTFARTMLGMSQAPTVPGATPPGAPPLEAASPTVTPEVPRPASPVPPAEAPAAVAPVHYADTKLSFGNEPAQAEHHGVAPAQVAESQHVPPQHVPPQQATLQQATLQQASLQVGAPQGALPQPAPRPVAEHVAPQAVPSPRAASQPRAEAQSRPVIAEPLPDDLAVPGAGRRGPLRVVVAFLLLGAAGLAGATVGRPTLERLLKGEPEAPSAPAGGAVQPLVDKARQLVREGDLGGARDHLERAAAAGVADPAQGALIAGELARVDILAAEVEELRLLFIPPDQKELVDQVKESLMDRLDRARKSVATAAKAAPADPSVLRGQMSLARLAGDRARAVTLSANLSAANATAEDVYSFAALDLTDTPPKYAEAIDRLSAVVGSEGRLGIVRGALIYALARSGDRERASVEFERLKGQVMPGSRLLPDIAAFMQREAGSGEAAAAVTAEAPPGASGVPAVPAPPGAAPAGGPDFRVRLQRAHDALGKGDLNQADSLYRSVLQDNSGNTEAVAGLADVARRRGQSAEAARLYDQVLQSNPSYLPALIARADMLWSSGERSQALRLYRRVTDQVGPESSYGKHAQSRIDAAAADNGAQHSPPAAPEKSTPPPDAGDTPNIDTTDLQ